MQNDELRRAQAEIEEARIKYANLFDFSPVGYITLDRKGHITEINLAASEFLKRQRRTLLNNVFSQFVRPEHRTQFLELKGRAFETGEKQRAELRLNDADGASFWVEMESIVHRDVLGDGAWMECAFIDITARKQKEQELLRLAAAVEQAGEGVVITAPDGVIDYVNPAFEALVGRPKCELIGRLARDILAGGSEDSDLFGAWSNSSFAPERAWIST